MGFSLHTSGGLPLPLPQVAPTTSRPIGWDNSRSTVTLLPSTAVFFNGTYRGAKSVIRPTLICGVSKQEIYYTVFQSKKLY